MKLFYVLTVLVFLASVPAASQHHYSNWVRRSATDTTIVSCWGDSLTSVRFPAYCMSGMMYMMYPDSVFCRIDRLPLDSLHLPYDSTFLMWHRVQVGVDSSHFNYMQCGWGSGYNTMMQFMRNLNCYLYWDSLWADSTHRRWHPTGVMGWNGSQWVALSNVSITGNRAVVVTSSAYAALALVGRPSQVSGVSDARPLPDEYDLSQNYPNPFNPTTTISYALPVRSHVTLTVFNSLGQQVTILVNGDMDAGNHQAKFNAAGLASGVYFYRLQAGSFLETKKLLLVR